MNISFKEIFTKFQRNVFSVQSDLKALNIIAFHLNQRERRYIVFFRYSIGDIDEQNIIISL